jgi:multicomponent Na+:H+ antiporter subunit D
VVARIGSTRIEDWAGLGRRMPWTMAAFVVGGLSLIGVPGTVGFVSKWYLVLGTLEAEWNFAAVLILMSSLLALVYIGRIIEIVWFREPPEGAPLDGSEWAPLGQLLPTWTLIAATVFFGLNTELTVGVASRCAQLLGAGG